MIDHTLLKYDGKTGYALVMTSLTAPQPFVECYKYDLESREWSQGHYFSRLEEALAAFNEDTGGPHVSIGPSDVFCEIKWCREDVRRRLEDFPGVEWATEENIDRVIGLMGKWLQEGSTEQGWEIIADSYCENDLVPPEAGGPAE